MNRFVRSDELTLPLSHGDTITIRRELTHGERLESYRRAYALAPDGKTLVRDPLKTSMALVTSYLVDWTFRDEADRLVPIRGLRVEELIDTLNAIADPSFMEILSAINAHEAALAVENSRPEAPPPSALTSTSPVAADGGTNGSAT